jgi:hypothetical protein
LFFAIEAAIMSLALEMSLGIPLSVGYVVSSLVVIPLVTHGITFISGLQLWTQPVWLVLHLLPFIFIAFVDLRSFEAWTHFAGTGAGAANSFNILLFGTASTVVFSLVAQIGEQVDFLRFLPARNNQNALMWRIANWSAGAGWIVPGMLKMLAGSFLAFLAIEHLVPADKPPSRRRCISSPSNTFSLAADRARLYRRLCHHIADQDQRDQRLCGLDRLVEFLLALTHSHPGRVVWLVFNVTIALMLMELGIFKMLEHILGLYSIVAVAWVGALVADLHDQQAARPEPRRHRVQARASL